MNSPVNTGVRWRMITTDAELAACCASWAGATSLALDTEFMRVSTFYPQPALYQVCDGVNIVLIDPLGIRDWEPLTALFTDPGILKILHSCSEDLALFLSHLGILPAPLFDTQVAGSVLGQALSVSYQNMVRDYLGIEIPKGETRSDWLQRPLSAEQLEYAALDVAFLHEIHAMQARRLADLGRTEWMTEEAERLLLPHAEEQSRDFSRSYESFKSGWQLGPQQRAALQSLAAWREERARERDKPRSWILKDAALFTLAQNLPQSKAGLAKIPDLGDAFIRHEGERVLARLAVARALPEAECPPPMAKPHNQAQKTKLSRARDVIEQKATELGLAPEFLCRRKALHALFEAVETRQPGAALELPPEFRGWREDVLLEPLLEVLQ